MPVRSHWCDECNVDRLTNQALRRHVAAKHLGIRPFQCQNCPLAFSYQSTLQKHNTQSCSLLIQKQKAIGRSIECDRCNYETPIKNQMLHHQMYSCGKRTEPDLLRCDQCDYAITKGANAREQLTRHVFSNNIAHRSTWICDQCGQTYSNKRHLNNHMETKHTTIAPRSNISQSKRCVCDRCNDVLTRGGLNRHLYSVDCTTVTHRSQSGQRLLCDICNHHCAGGWLKLSQHILTRHFPSLWQRFVCEQCGRSFACTKSMVDHLRRGCVRARGQTTYDKTLRVTADIVTEVKAESEDGGEQIDPTEYLQ